MESEGEPIDMERLFREMPTPSDEMLASPAFEAVWQCIKTWSINVPAAYGGHWPTTGSHVRLILDALSKAGIRLEIARKAGQIVEKHGNPKMLFSEDIW